MINIECPEKMKDWQRVLAYWKLVRHRHGLTVQALAAITGRDQDALWGEIKNPRNMAGGSYCFVINAPIVTLRVMRVPLWDRETNTYRYEYNISAPRWEWDGTFNTQTMEFIDYPEEEQKERLQAKIVQLMDEFPAPKYKGLKKEQGLLYFTPARYFAALKQVACNKRSPIDGKLYKEVAA